MRLNRCPFADDIFKCIFLNENEWISPRISLKFVPKVRINNIPALVQILAWRRSGGTPLSEPMMVSLLTHICVTRPQWFKWTLDDLGALQWHNLSIIRSQISNCATICATAYSGWQQRADYGEGIFVSWGYSYMLGCDCNNLGPKQDQSDCGRCSLLLSGLLLCH